MTTTRLALALTAGVLGLAPSSDSGTSEPPQEPVTVEFITPRSAFTDDVSINLDVAPDGEPTQQLAVSDPTHVVTARITLQPGAMFPWNVHPGPALINVTEGEVAYIYGPDCVERRYPAGTAFIDVGGAGVHTVQNVSDGVSMTVATFFAAPAEGPITITEGVEAPDCNPGSGVSAE
jgi:quercetin dioxygenase-like cupin family protein